MELDDFYGNTRRQDAAIQDKMAELGSELVKEFLDKVSIWRNIRVKTARILSFLLFLFYLENNFRLF